MFRLAIAVFAASAFSPAVAEEVPEAMTVSYACDAGGRLEVSYINPADSGESFAVVLHDDALVAMKAGPTGSGVRYVSLDDTKLVWHVKGDEGFLARDADMSMLAENCTAAGG